MKAIATKKAPAAIGPYVQGVIAGGFLFASGQIALDPQGLVSTRLSKRRVFLTIWTISRRSTTCMRILSGTICPLDRPLPWKGFPKGLSWRLNSLPRSASNRYTSANTYRRQCSKMLLKRERRMKIAIVGFDFPDCALEGSLCRKEGIAIQRFDGKSPEYILEHVHDVDGVISSYGEFTDEVIEAPRVSRLSAGRERATTRSMYLRRRNTGWLYAMFLGTGRRS